MDPKGTLLLLTAISIVVAIDSDESTTLADTNNLFQEFYIWRIVRTPELATVVGNDAYASMLETYTKDRYKEDLVASKSLLERAEDLLSKPNLTEYESLNLRLLKAQLTTFIDGYPFKGYYFPMNFLEGVQVDFQRLPDMMNLEKKKDYDNLIDRYGKFTVLADQIIVMMQEAMKENYMFHNDSMIGLIDQLHSHFKKPANETAFWKPFKKLGDKFQDASVVQDLQARGKRAIETSIQPGMLKLCRFMKRVYLPRTRKEIAITTLPNGPAYYAQCLKFHTSTSMTASEIHAKGLQEVDRIEGQMRKVVEELGLDMTLKQFSDMLRSDEKFFFNSAQEMLDAYNVTMRQIIDPKLKLIFWNPPTMEYKIEETPKASENAPAAFYLSGTADGKRKGTVMVNTNKYSSQSRHDIITLALHEVNPGHHLESSYGLLQPDLPSFRRSMSDSYYSFAPSRFPINTAYIEGWGLYSEKLGFDLGLYDNLYDRYAHYSGEIFRACRLVVDTGIHAMGWSKTKALDYMLEHTAASKKMLSDEIHRYITWPGQACGYKIGELKITELRNKAKEQLGDKFDIRDYHEIVLRSAGPLEVLEEEVDKYILQKLQPK